jgi:pyruvate formate lyase activating enzyme
MTQSDASGVVFHIMRFSVHDGPGLRTAVFFKGCPLSCWWCHNPESQEFEPEVMYSAEQCSLCGECLAACPQHAIERTAGRMTVNSSCVRCGTCVETCGREARNVAGTTMTAAEVLATSERDVIFFDQSGGGVTFTGGEPLCQPEFLEALLRGCRERRIHTAIETCGAAPRETLLRVAGLADLVLYDVKLIDERRHRQYTGARNRNVLGNLRALTASHAAVIVRVPVVPGINDSAEDRRELREFLADVGPRHVELLPYHGTAAEKYRRLGREYRTERTPTPGDTEMAEFAAELRAAGVMVKERS